MENTSDFLDKLLKINKEHKKKGGRDNINIFDVLFHGYEEVTLHSRFISYLLSHNPEFLRLFVRNILEIGENDFDLNNCEVYPNDKEKVEKWEIDLLIINRQKRQAILIENKLNAIDNIHKNGNPCKENNYKSYRGQLERYYYTITTGLYKKSNRYLEIEDKSFICDEDKTYVYYLTLHKDPSTDTIGELKHFFDPTKHKINYYKIQEWLQSCFKQNEKSFLSEIIQQYLNLIKRITTDNKRVLAITDLIAENENYWQIALNNIDSFKDVYRDIKWHTIHRFFTELTHELKIKIKAEIKSIPNENSIAKVTHANKKEELKIEFTHNGTPLQIVNDDKGFTLTSGIRDKICWGYFSDNIKNIKFQDFSNEETFYIINNENRKSIIGQMIKEIDDDKIRYMGTCS